ncbi:MAG: hypothetical protein NTZ25_03160 [Candidatus Peregrinibacteria bacterium]|nr:hypothetical protein [Candidatus Peregrinibacteria bacterium]
MNNNQSQQDAAKIFKDADSMYEAIVAQLNIDPRDEVYKALVMGMLKRQTKDHLIFSIWNNIDDEMAKHMREFINQTAITMPWMKHEDTLIEFAMMYPNLMEKIYAGMTVFFQNFIKKFNEIQAS